MTKYICFEGGEGTYKTTTARVFSQFLREHGFRVLETKEPGTTNVPLTMELRKIMLSNEYDAVLTDQARELISQAIRSIHMERLVKPAIESDEYDYIIQDRGILSGQIYAHVCGNSVEDINSLRRYILGDADKPVYDHIIIFHNDNGLSVAVDAKDEFGGGDAMESRGDAFHQKINQHYRDVITDYSKWGDLAYAASSIDVCGKTTHQIIAEIIFAINSPGDEILN